MTEGVVERILLRLAPGIRAKALATYTPYYLTERGLVPYLMTRDEWMRRELAKADFTEAQTAMMRRLKRDLSGVPYRESPQASKSGSSK